MNAESPLYWSHIEIYEECPFKFLLTYGWEGLDLGEGPGKPKRVPWTESRHNQVMGLVASKIVEKFYNEETYREGSKVVEILEGFAAREFGRQSRSARNPIDYDKARMTSGEMIDYCKRAARGFVETVKKHRLLGTYARSEVHLLGWLNKWVTIAGIADIIIRREDSGITILDGKNTDRRERVNPDQLRWYALVFWREHGKIPDRLGFLWFRYPAGSKSINKKGEEVIEEGITWIPFDREDLMGLAKRAVAARDSMRRRKFEANPEPSICRRCRFEAICEARQEQRIRNADRRRPKNIKELDDEEGFVDFSL